MLQEDGSETQPKKKLYALNSRSHQHTFDSKDLSIEENDDEENDEIDEEYQYRDKSDLVNSKTINDILKYGAGHQSVDSNPGETQSEWSDDDDKDDDEVKGKFIVQKTHLRTCE